MAEDESRSKKSTEKATSKPTVEVKKKDKSKKSSSKEAGAVANGSVASAQEWQLQPSQPPKGFLPFSHNIITPEIQKYAAEKLNETEETKARALKEFHELVDNDPDLHLTAEDNLILIWLRTKKFDAKKAFDLLKLGLTYVESYRYLLERNEPEIVRKVNSCNMFGFLPYRDQDGRAIMYTRADKWDPNEIPAADAIFTGVMAVQNAGHNPVNQILGFVVILDLKDLKIQQVLAMSRWMIFGTVLLQRACPCFLKAFHVINISPFYKIGWKLVKPLLSEKIRKRFIFHKSSDLSTLYEYVPKEILPPELGGNVPFTNEHWAKDIDKIERDYFYYLSQNFMKSKRKNKSTPSRS
ncbi:retinaldehyde-binding protein 1-like [Argiope bruennichi]|uniref:retinaldehyde-binding protein 1-like n=1 Tax=Argiope bruennichi TaxID=94029 RepID=UPI002495370B|nr:retinaldehyde-binding protein 1-like [Argiope bruennichi]